MYNAENLGPCIETIEMDRCVAHFYRTTNKYVPIFAIVSDKRTSDFLGMFGTPTGLNQKMKDLHEIVRFDEKLRSF